MTATLSDRDSGFINPYQYFTGTRGTERQREALALITATPFLFDKAPSITTLQQSPNELRTAQEVVSRISELKLLQLGGEVKTASGSFSYVKSGLKGVQVTPGIAGFRTDVRHVTVQSEQFLITDLGGGQVHIGNVKTGGETIVAGSVQGQTVVFATREQIVAGIKVPARAESRIPLGRFGKNLGLAVALSGAATTEAANFRLQQIENRLASDIVLRTAVANQLQQATTGSPAPDLTASPSVGGINFVRPSAPVLRGSTRAAVNPPLTPIDPDTSHALLRGR